MSDLSRRTFLAGAAGLLATTGCSTPSRRQPSTVPSTFELQRFIDDVKRANQESASQEAVEAVLTRAVSVPGSVIRELGEPSQTLTQPLYRDDTLSIMNIVWPPLAVLVPHNHLMWATIGIYAGRENNILWERTGQTIRASAAASLAEREVFSLPRDAIHSVTNPVAGYTCAIHVYGGDLPATKLSQWDALTLREEPFDVEAGRRILQEADKRFAGE